MSTVETRCIVCGAPFEATRSDAIFCGERCRKAAQRTRQASDALVTVGGVQGAVSAFSTTAGSFGEIGHAEITTCALRGTPAPDFAGRTPVELTLSGERVWSGDLERLTRQGDTVTVRARGLEGRLASQVLRPGTFEHMSGEQLAEQAAVRAGLRFEPSGALDARSLSAVTEADGAPGGSFDALRFLTWMSRETGAEFHVKPDGELVFAPPVVAERLIEARDIQVVSFAPDAHDAPVAVVVRSSMLALTGGGHRQHWLRTGSVSGIPAGIASYLVVLHGKRQDVIDEVRGQVQADLARALIAVECDTPADPSLVPGALVRFDHESLREMPLRVTRVIHSFTAEGGLATHVEALFLPPAPKITDSLPAVGRFPPAQVPARVYVPGVAA